MKTKESYLFLESMLERCEYGTKDGDKDEMRRRCPLYKQQDWGPLEHMIMKLEEKASEPLRLLWPKVRVGSSLSTVSGSTQTFVSVDVISFESCLGLDLVILLFKYASVLCKLLLLYI